MAAGYGKITAKLAEPIDKVSDELVNLINQNIKPPQPVGADDVFVRAMLVVSDEINSFGGRFPADEHNRLASLLIDSPVLVGHRKDKLPIGRNFHSTIISRDGRQWIKSYFYWLKSAAGAENLQENIDGGIYKECSIGFTYFFPECSVCGDDMRRCNHQPLSKLVRNGKESIVHFNYRQIERVLETSLVYRGALPDTAVTKDLEQGKMMTVNESVESFKSNMAAKIEYQIEQDPNPDSARMYIKQGDLLDLLLLRHFNLNRLRHGARFVTEILSSRANSKPGGSVIGRGEISRLIIENGMFIFEMTGLLVGRFGLRTAELEGETKFLFYRIENQEARLGEDDFDELTGIELGVFRGEINR